jgi:uncharacterized protein YbjT (DUF2867 family)
MARVLVAGGTGTLGRRLVPLLVERGHEVRSLSRRGAATVPGAEAVRGDVRTGEGLASALGGVDTVVHAATSVGRHMRATEVEGTRRLLAAVGDRPVHVIYLSIVGVDGHRFPYYRAKRQAEELIERSAVPWTIRRATQFHDLLDRFLAGRAFFRTPHLAFQVVDAGEVARRLADHVEAGAAGRAADIGGPEVVPIVELARIRREIRGRAATLVPVPRLGFLRDFDAGRHLCPESRLDSITWRQWLENS